MKKTLIIAIAIITLGIGAHAQTEGSCALDGWIEDRDPNGTNIREKPGVGSKVLVVAPHAKQPGEETMVEIIGYSNGWLKIRSAGDVDGNFKWEGIGWVSAKKVVFSVEDASGGGKVPLYAAANRKSKKLASVPESATFDIVGFSCFGFKISYKGKTGWIWKGDACGNPVTTCP